jgi:PAP2 superfamily
MRPRLRWWREVIYTASIYLVYSTVRNQFGSNGGPLGQANRIAYQHALDVIRIQDAIGLFIEPSLQRWYLDLPANGFIAFWNVFYGTAHFIVTAFALIWLYRRDKERYPTWRNTLAFTTLFALIGFASFSLMPPRLLDSTSEFGPPAELNAERDFDIEDTLANYDTFWSFDSETLKDVSNQYAAMPSLHMGWSTWSALVLFPLVRRRWARVLVALYPAATFFCIIVTANHFWLDAAVGLATLGVGYLLGSQLTEFWKRREAQPVALA